MFHIKPEDMLPEDFPEDTLIRQIAEVDIPLACEISKEYGGVRQYIHMWKVIGEKAVHREIITRAFKGENLREIAQYVGLSLNRVQEIARNGIAERYLQQRLDALK